MWWVIGYFTGFFFGGGGGPRHDRVELAVEPARDNQLGDNDALEHRRNEQEEANRQRDIQIQTAPGEEIRSKPATQENFTSKQRSNNVYHCQVQLKGRRKTLLLLHRAKPKIRNRKARRQCKSGHEVTTSESLPSLIPPDSLDTELLSESEGFVSAGIEYSSLLEDNTSTNSSEDFINRSIQSSSVSSFSNMSTEYGSAPEDFSSSVPVSVNVRNASVQFSNTSNSSEQLEMVPVIDSDEQLYETHMCYGNQFRCINLKSNATGKPTGHWERFCKLGSQCK